MTDNTFAFRLKELLEHKQLTLQTIANALGVSRPAVHKWTRGGEIDDEKLRRLASFLQVNWLWLRYGAEAQIGTVAEATTASPVLPMTELRRKYTADIIENEARMKLAQEIARIVTWEWNLLTDAVVYSANVEAVYGWHVSCNEDFWPHILPEDVANMHEVYQQSTTEGTPHELEFRIILPDGSLRWIISRAMPVRDVEGRLVKMVGISMDNTERKATEQALQYSEARFQTLFDLASEGMAYVSLDGHWLEANPALCELLGYQRHGLTQQLFNQLIEQADSAQPSPSHAALLAGDIGQYQIEKNVITGHGQPRRLRITLAKQPAAQDPSPACLVMLLKEVV